ncbi:hypothetical protein [Streptomyces sp. NPDC056670]|uniref:ATP-dependent DNA ligase n=1 Tax=Streptomyces sp. NPDC056670 TaxID=3345904 RepID=UPI0036A6F40C
MSGIQPTVTVTAWHALPGRPAARPPGRPDDVRPTDPTVIAATSLACRSAAPSTSAAAPTCRERTTSRTVSSTCTAPRSAFSAVPQTRKLMRIRARLDGEVVIWESDRLTFERLQQRLARRGAGAAEGSRLWPAHYVAFDLVHAGADLTGWPYERRRSALKALFADYRLAAPLTLCPSTTDPTVAEQ